LASNLPHRAGKPALAHRLNQASRWYVPPILWLAVGILALAFRRPRNALALAVPTVAGLLVIVLTALGLPAEPHYSVPVAPAFVLLAGGALLAPRRVAVTELRAPVLRYGGIAVGIVAAAWAVEHYVKTLRDVVRLSYAPHDLAVFLAGAGKVLHAASPYAYNADQTYAYPPLLAFLVSPFHPLSAGAAAFIWIV